MNHSLSLSMGEAMAESGPSARFPRQNGQALLEGLVALLVLLSLWVGVAWLGRLQDIALQAAHASRYAAFASGRDSLADMETEVRQHYFSGPAHQWSDRQGRRLLGPKLDEVALLESRDSSLAATAQAGGAAIHAQTLRRDWRLEDVGILSSRITVAPQQLVLRRHTAILTGAGHAADDTAVQQRVAASPLAWGNNANTSYAHGARVAGAMTQVDAAWGRTEPIFDWLTPWAGYVPELHLGK